MQTANAAVGGRVLYRTMLDDGSGRPRLADDANSLGVRTDSKTHKRLDMTVEPDGVSWRPKADPEGLSVQIADPRGAPPPRLPKELGGTSKGVLWHYDEANLPELLSVVPDDRKMDASRGHAVLEAKRACTLAEYKDALATSQPSWRKSDVKVFR